MASSKKPRKKHDPRKIQDFWLGKIAERCYLYHWDSAVYSDPDQQFRVAVVDGRSISQVSMRTTRNESVSVSRARKAVLNAATTPTEWVIQVIACFIDEETYYEESADILTGKIRIVDGDLEKLVESVAKDLKNSGNEKHYIDSVWIARVKTDRLMINISSDEWEKSQAAHREKAVRAILEGEQP
jgi:hypothetical protein